MDADPPWGPPAGGRADGGGLTGKRHFGKPLETMGRKARCVGAYAPRSTGCMANRGKPWGAKPEATGRAGRLESPGGDWPAPP